MSLRFSVNLPIESVSESGRTGGDLRHGELVAGRVTRVTPDGEALIRFPDFQARAPAESLLKVGTRVYASVQKTRDETVLSLLPAAEEGDILSGRLADSNGPDALARFGSLELRVRIPPGSSPLSPGAQMRAQLQMTGGSPSLKMMPSAQGLISGTVLAVREDGTALLDVGNMVLLARAGGDAQPGDLVQAALRQIGDKTLLLIIQNPSAEGGHGASQAGFDAAYARILDNAQYGRLLAALLSGAIAVDEPARALLHLLQELLARSGSGKPSWANDLAAALETMFLNPDKADLATQVASAVRESGVFFEASLLERALSRETDSLLPSDLKMALLAANRELSKLLSPDRGADLSANPGEIASRIGQLLDLVTAEQLLNSRFHTSGQLYIQLPFGESSGMERVEIRISRQSGGGSRKIDPRNVTLALVVVTSRLGRIRASLSIVDGQVSCQFRASRDSVTDLLNRHAALLREGLEKLKYRVTYIGCTTSNDDRDYSLADALGTVVASGLDVSA